MNFGIMGPSGRIYWGSFWAWVGVGFLGALLLARELMGIAHVWGLDPITVEAERNPLIGWLFAAWFLIAFVWWRVHLYSHRLRP